MSISYEKLFELMESKGVTKYYLRQNGVYSKTIERLLKNETIDTQTISKLCKLLDCQPGDIMEYIKDDDNQD